MGGAYRRKDIYESNLPFALRFEIRSDSTCDLASGRSGLADQRCWGLGTYVTVILPVMLQTRELRSCFGLMNRERRMQR